MQVSGNSSNNTTFMFQIIRIRFLRGCWEALEVKGKQKPALGGESGEQSPPWWSPARPHQTLRSEGALGLHQEESAPQRSHQTDIASGDGVVRLQKGRHEDTRSPMQPVS